MFGKLVLQEIKYQFKNITFYGFIFMVILMFYTQLGIPKSSDLQMPKPNQEYYGAEKITDKVQEMKHVYWYLHNDYINNKVEKYHLIYMPHKLNENEKKELKKCMDKIGYYNNEGVLQIKVSYDEYLKTIREVDKKLGGSTIYSDKYRDGILNRNRTYEEAVTKYNEIKEKDKYTNAYGRLFADYMGITAGLFPIFLAVLAVTRIRKYWKNKSSEIYRNFIGKQVLAKYTAVCICLMLCYLGLATYTTLAYSKFGVVNNYIIDKWAIYKYTLTWLTPTVLFSTGFGMLIAAILSNGAAAIIVQVILYLVYMFFHELSGDYGLTRYIIRFNTFGVHNSYMQWRHAIITNRIFYVILSIIIIFITAFLLKYRMKRQLIIKN